MDAQGAGRRDFVANLLALHEQKECVTRRIRGTSSLFLNQQYSDLTIICENETFHAHKNILCTGSSYFEAACNNSGFTESQGTFDLRNSETMFVKQVLSFLYTADYNFDPEKKVYKDMKAAKGTKRSADGEPVEEPEPPTDLLTDEEVKIMEKHPAYLHYRVYAEADYFMVDDLKKKAAVYFEHALMAKRVPPDNFVELVQEIFTDRPNILPLQEALLAHCVRNLRYYQRGRQPMLTTEFLKQRPIFANAFCLELTKEHIRVLNSHPGVILQPGGHLGR
ncbi:hypothetical protein N7528_001767 [Penicillium herquei]|nr:hypothetical protein N7528_001767 [Penicillium herquei]